MAENTAVAEKKVFTTSLSEWMARQAQVEMDEVYQVAQAEIAENANTVEFIEGKADVVDATAAEVTEEQAEDSTLPPFMQSEES